MAVSEPITAGSAALGLAVLELFGLGVTKAGVAGPQDGLGTVGDLELGEDGGDVVGNRLAAKGLSRNYAAVVRVVALVMV
jgi:hypothetical protein